MTSLGDWKLPASVQPKPADYDYDLERALTSVLALSAQIAPDAFTAGTLGTERAGHAVLITEDVALTIGYLVTEAEAVWLRTGEGRAVPGHVLAYDQATGFGLVQALGTLDVPPLALGDSGRVRVGQAVVVAGAGGRQRSVAGQIVAKQQFAGYWEYLLDEAIFTAPAHPHWGGTAVIGPDGRLIGIGSLHLQQGEEGRTAHLNMVVPIDLLKPILNDLLTRGQVNHPPRPWLGLFATEVEGKIVVMSAAEGGPAQRAGIESGDIVLAIAGEGVNDLAGFYRRLWGLGSAGVEVPLGIYREGRGMEVRVASGDRNRFLKAPRLH